MQYVTQQKQATKRVSKLLTAQQLKYIKYFERVNNATMFALTSTNFTLSAVSQQLLTHTYNTLVQQKVITVDGEYKNATIDNFAGSIALQNCFLKHM